jgi:hypothetical protein
MRMSYFVTVAFEFAHFFSHVMLQSVGKVDLMARDIELHSVLLEGPVKGLST